MPSLSVEPIDIAGLLEKVRTNAWLVPSFQRDFVWSEADVTSLVLSVIEARPIGMATLWEQPDDGELDLEPVSIPDTKQGEQTTVALNPDVENKPNKFYAVLDGRQRCTALAMAFGGLRATSGLRRFSGRFYLDVTQPDISERVKYFRESEVNRRGLHSLSTCVGQGLFPLAAPEGQGIMGQWMGYLQELTKAGNYADGDLPEPEVLEQRNKILQQAFEGINSTILAVYTVSSEYALGDICEIFETLNTTGTKVSTVDLLHSWLYADTAKEDVPFLLREWIDDLGEQDGAAGWSSKSDRPELIAQMVTACYVALDSEKPAPRPVGRKGKAPTITSVKAGDLLATPTEFWQQAATNKIQLAGYISGFQNAVAGGRFPLSACPYPVTLTIYSALHWYMDHDSRYSGQWSEADVKALFRAFFWRTALLSRYDQGFLSQSATDLKALKELLFERKGSAPNEWSKYASAELTKLMQAEPPSQDELVDRLLHAKPPGAMGRSLSLPVLTRPTQDLLDPTVSIVYPSQEPVELHHIYPQSWCANNKHGALGQILDTKHAQYDYVRSVANLTPLSRQSNNAWRAKTPGQALVEKTVTPGTSSERLNSHYISDVAYNSLTAATPDPLGFWTSRANDIAQDLLIRCQVAL